MGCTQSNQMSDGHRDGVFDVVNIDNDGKKTKKGVIELRETEIVFKSPDSEPVVWDLRYLRRYGYDSNLFSFESGRRSTTGHGIFAFQCRDAELLFNMLQERIQRMGEEDQRLLPGDRPRSQQISERGGRPVSGLNGIRSLASGDEAISIAQINPMMNGNGSLHNQQGQHEYINRDVVQNHENQLHLTATEPLNVSHTRVVNGLSSNLSFTIGNGQGHYAVPTWHYNEALPEMSYVNVPLDGGYSSPRTRPADVIYCNDPLSVNNSTCSAANTDDPILNYAQVDVQQSNGVSKNSNGVAENNSTAVKAAGKQLQDKTQVGDSASGCGYTSIDFERTAALINSRTLAAADDGPRKTRHNSNIEELRSM